MTATFVPFRSSPEPAFVPVGVSPPDAETSAIRASEDFATLRDRARELVAKGSYRQASGVYRAAVEIATVAGETDLADEGLCGWSAAETELGNGTTVTPELRRILLGSRVDHNCCLAAYTLARAHELQGQTKKALFYARIVRDRAAHVQRSGLIGIAHNLMGNLLIADGREAEAAAEYRTALRRSDSAPAFWKALAEGNLGYCLVIGASKAKYRGQARLREGLRLIYRSLRTFRRERAEVDMALSHLDLCFAHMELRRFASATRHGQRALELAERHENPDLVKNCLYLLGQTARLEGDVEAARRFFREIEQRFYPERTELTDMLVAFDLRKIVNLRA